MDNVCRGAYKREVAGSFKQNHPVHKSITLFIRDDRSANKSINRKSFHVPLPCITTRLILEKIRQLNEHL